MPLVAHPKWRRPLPAGPPPPSGQPWSGGSSEPRALVFTWDREAAYSAQDAGGPRGVGPRPLLGRHFCVFLCGGHRKQECPPVHVSVMVRDAFVKRAVAASLTRPCCHLLLSSSLGQVLTGSPRAQGLAKAGSKSASAEWSGVELKCIYSRKMKVGQFPRP